MKRTIITVLLTLALTSAAWLIASNGQSTWTGVDETVVEKFAEEAGRPAQTPWINTDQGDLLLFVFLIAGSLGGFVAGYAAHKLFAAPSGQPGVTPRKGTRSGAEAAASQ